MHQSALDKQSTAATFCDNCNKYTYSYLQILIIQYPPVGDTKFKVAVYVHFIQQSTNVKVNVNMNIPAQAPKEETKLKSRDDHKIDTPIKPHRDRHQPPNCLASGDASHRYLAARLEMLPSSRTKLLPIAHYAAYSSGSLTPTKTIELEMRP
jgi:hypothetical protein